jgi:hypothetical protein
MSLRSWTRTLFARPVTRIIRRAPARRPLSLVALEAREVPAVFMDPGFEQAVVSTDPGGFGYSPPSPWSFISPTVPGDGAGVVANGSGFGNPNAPQGTQAAFAQKTGSFSQTDYLEAGMYSINFMAAQRNDIQGVNHQTFDVVLDGQVVGSFEPRDEVYRPYGTPSFVVAAAGTHARVPRHEHLSQYR